MTTHINANKGDYAETVLLPGDPLRAKFIADNFLTDVKEVNKVRNCLGYTGKYKGNDVSVQAGGMGQPSNAIYIHELYNDFDVKTIIRVGSCGGISKDVKVGDIVVGVTACSDSNMLSQQFGRFNYSPLATLSLSHRLNERMPTSHMGAMVSSDYFYNPDPNWWKVFQDYGVLAVEMESYILFSLANKFKKRSATVCTVADHLDTTVDRLNMDWQEREQGFSYMVENTLDTLL